LRQFTTRLFHTFAGKYGQLVLRFRGGLVVATHLALIVAAHLTAFVLRFEGDIQSPFDRMIWRYLPLVLSAGSGAMWGSMISAGSFGHR
jgi:hypothetical protein